MSLTVIIAEKADAGRRIAYFLSGGKSKTKREKGATRIEFSSDNMDYLLIPLSGHPVEIDFPKSMKNWESTDLKDLINAKIEKNAKNKGLLEQLRNASLKGSRFIVATDYDREGELIGVEALEMSGIDSSSREIKRAKFSSLTGEEINASFKNLIDVDYSLADSAYAREVVDLIWGAVLTRFFSIALHRYGRNFLSAGRVQTPTLAIVVDRELEIRNFIPETFYRLSVKFQKDGEFTGYYEGGNIFSREDAESIFSKIVSKKGKVLDYSMKEERIPKPPPFNTTEFLREASRIGVSPAKAMKIAESLYTRGLISYPRTDNTVYPRTISLKGVLEKIKKSRFSDIVDMVLNQKSIRPSRGRQETTDHPPIYPVSSPKEKLTGDFDRIYELVVRRFLATLYVDGRREKRNAKISVDGINFITEGLKVTDRGWLDLYPYRKVQEIFHPDLEIGENIAVLSKDMAEDQTKPPPRYDMSSLLKLMEDLNLGTKSTRHDIIEKLQLRGFIEGNPVRPTPLGIGFISAVRTVDSRISEPEMTARLEQEMEKISRGELTSTDVVKESREMLRSVLDQLNGKKGEISSAVKGALDSGTPIGTCPFHGTPVVISGERGNSRIRCVTDGCRINFPIKMNGKMELLDEKCTVCGLPLVKIIRRGQSPQKVCPDPDCKYNRETTVLGICPKDGGQLIIRQSKYGKRFLGCSNYPNCDRTYPLPQMGLLRATGEKCPVCQAPLILLMRGKRAWKFCPDMNCSYNGVKKNAGNKIKENTA